MTILRYAALTLIFLGMGVLYSLQVPKLKHWLLNEVRYHSRTRLGLEINASEIDFKLFPPGFTLTNTLIKPRGALATKLAPVTISHFSVSVNMISLIAGHLELGKILIDHPKVSLFIKNDSGIVGSQNVTSSNSIRLPWRQIINLPVQSLQIWNAEIQAKISDINLALSTHNLAINIDKNPKAIKLEIFAPDILVKKSGTSEDPLPLTFATRMILEEKAVEVSALKITHNKNFLIARGVARGSILDLTWSTLNGRTLAHLDLSQALNVVKSFIPDLKSPDMSGILNVELLAREQKGSEPVISGEIDTKDVKVAKVNVGDLYSKIKYTTGAIGTNLLKIKNSAGLFQIQDLVFKTEGSQKFSFRTVVEKIQISELLKNIGLKSAPVHALVDGKIPCEGELNPLRLACAGELSGETFAVVTKDNGKSKTLVSFDQFHITSTLEANKEKIIFPKAILSIGSSMGEASGFVEYSKGFNFTFHTNGLNFKDISNLAGLKYDGTIAATGTTTGDSDRGIIEATVKSDGFWFEDFGLGAVSLGLHYVNNVLSFSQIKGSVGSSTYIGDVAVDFGGDKNPTTLKAHTLMPNVDLSDLLNVFARKVTLPFFAQGKGRAEIDASGPVSLSELTYKLRSHFNLGKVAKESFNELTFNVHGIKGHAFSDDVSLKKGNGQIKLAGDVLPTGIMNVAITSENMRIDDFDSVKSVSESITGLLAFDMSLKNYILHPFLQLNSKVSQTILNQQPMDDSDFSVALNPSGLKAVGQIFGQKIKANLIYSLTENGPFSLKFDTVNFDFSSLLGLASGKGTKRDYETDLTAHVDLASRGGGFWHSSGGIFADKFYVRHGTNQMKNSQPIKILFSNGAVDIQSFKLNGDNTDLTVSGNRNQNEILNLNLSGRIDLTLLGFLTPFIRDMRGILTLSTQIGGKVSHPDLLGSAFINKGYFKIDALPHPFENVEADLLFSQSRILINRLKGYLGGGKFLANGSIVLKEFGNIPLELTGDLTGATLSIPEGLTTKGGFHFSLLGNWFPYVLKGEYSIDSGLFSKNFGADSSGDNNIKRSSYLPKLILQREFLPLTLDITANFPKTLTVKNNILDAEVRGEVSIKGDPAQPNLKGDITALPNGRMFFRDTPFVISTAKLKLDTISDNSTIYSLGTTRVRDWDISLVVQGNLKDPKLSLTSSPSLTEQSIVSLLALGLTGDEVDTSTAANTQAGQVVGSTLLSANPLQKELKNKYGVNVHISQDVNDMRNVVTPRVVAEKQWTPQITTSVSHSLGERVTSDANVQYKFNKYFSVLGTYEARDYDPLAAGTSTPQSVSTDIFGFDFQYQVEFK